VKIIHRLNHQTAVPFSHLEMPAKIAKRNTFAEGTALCLLVGLLQSPPIPLPTGLCKKKGSPHIFFLKLILRICFFAKNVASSHDFILIVEL